MSLVQLALPLGKSGEAVKAGPIGLAVILLLCIACYFLFKSMSKHLKKVRENFPADEPTGDPVDLPSVEPDSAEVVQPVSTPPAESDQRSTDVT